MLTVTVFGRLTWILSPASGLDFQPQTFKTVIVYQKDALSATKTILFPKFFQIEQRPVQKQLLLRQSLPTVQRYDLPSDKNLPLFPE